MEHDFEWTNPTGKYVRIGICRRCQLKLMPTCGDHKGQPGNIYYGYESKRHPPHITQFGQFKTIEEAHAAALRRASEEDCISAHEYTNHLWNTR